MDLFYWSVTWWVLNGSIGFFLFPLVWFPNLQLDCGTSSLRTFCLGQQLSQSSIFSPFSFRYGCKWAKRFSVKSLSEKKSAKDITAKRFSLMRVWMKSEGEGEHLFAVLSFVHSLSNTSRSSKSIDRIARVLCLHKTSNASSISGFRCFHVQLPEESLRPLFDLISQHDVFCQSHFKYHYIGFVDIQRDTVGLFILHARPSRLRRSCTRYFLVFVGGTALHLFHHRRIRSRCFHHHHDGATSIQYSSLVYILWTPSELDWSFRDTDSLCRHLDSCIYSIQTKQRTEQFKRLTSETKTSSWFVVRCRRGRLARSRFSSHFSKKRRSQICNHCFLYSHIISLETEKSYFFSFSFHLLLRLHLLRQVSFVHIKRSSSFVFLLHTHALISP